MVGGIDLARALHKEIVNTKESSEFETVILSALN